MFAAIGKALANKVVTAVLALATIGGGIYFWRNPEDLATIWAVIKYALVWLGLVAVLPWATFFVPKWVLAKESNPASGLMLAGYLAVDVAAALWLMGGTSGHNTLTWAVLVVGFLAAAVYNYAACDSIAGHFEDG